MINMESHLYKAMTAVRSNRLHTFPLPSLLTLHLEALPVTLLTAGRGGGSNIFPYYPF